MPKIPKSREIAQAIRSVGRELKAATKEINQQAAKRLSRGDYAGAQSMIEIAQSISEFIVEVKALQSRWQEVRSSGKGSGRKKDSQTSLWEFYRPILQVLVALGGEATRKEIEGKLEGQIESTLKEGDFVKRLRGEPRWKRMVGRARKHMIAEKFIADERGFKWKITKKGEQAAKRTLKGK